MGSKQSTANSPSRTIDIQTRNSATGEHSSGQERGNQPNNNNNPGDGRQRATSLMLIPGASGGGAANNNGRDSRSSNPVNALDVLTRFNSGVDFLELLGAGNLAYSSASTTSSTAPQSLPIHFLHFNPYKCPLCKRTILPEEAELHLVMCITKPLLHYNEDILTEDKEEECVICLEELLKGNKIARLPCLCIYHKKCIDAWFEVNRSCPEHPSD